jgi:glycosyltransferase involved in cell wall biosynthesis
MRNYFGHVKPNILSKRFLIFLRNNKKSLYKLKIINLLIIYIYILFIFPIKKEKFDNSNIFFKINDFENLKNIDEKEINYFRSINDNNILLDKTNYNRSDHPDISIIVTAYNQDHCIYKALRSIQNQSIKNVEIIAIDDCSSDNSIKIIESFQKHDNRIIVLKNIKNEGKIKSRTQAIRTAKGKYITVLDGDDTFIHSNILYDSLYIANLANLDVIEFKASINGDIKYAINNYYKKNKITYQPELKTKFIVIKKDDYARPIINRSICFKLIKNKIFNEVINIIGTKYTEEYMLNYEDTIMSYILFKVANSYYAMKELGYYYSNKEKQIKVNLNNKCLCKNNNNKRIADPIKFLFFLFEKANTNKIESKILCHEMISINYYHDIASIVNSEFQYLLKIIETMVKSNYLSNGEKRKLIKIFDSLKKKFNVLKE